MANMATTTYKISGPVSEVDKLFQIIKDVLKDKYSVWLNEFAKACNIPHTDKEEWLRGWLREDVQKNGNVITFYTETKWHDGHELFDKYNELTGDQLYISYMCIECGNELFYAHDEIGLINEECYACMTGGMFEPYCDTEFERTEDAIEFWETVTGLHAEGISTDEKVDFINGYEYEDYSFFQIHYIEYIGEI